MLCRLRKTRIFDFGIFHVFIWCILNLRNKQYEFHIFHCVTDIDQWLGWYDLLQKISSVNKTKQNACRALHRLVEKAGVTLPLRLDAALITIKRRRPLGQYQAWWPFLTMSTWAEYILTNYPKMLLGGSTLEKTSEWQKTFHYFWETYRGINPGHPIYQSVADWRFTIPYCFHGDEGRGLARDPFLVLSFQPMIGFKGMDSCNDSSYLEKIQLHFDDFKILLLICVIYMSTIF